MTTPAELVARSDGSITAEQVQRWLDRGRLWLNEDGHIADLSGLKFLVAADLLDPPEEAGP